MPQYALCPHCGAPRQYIYYNDGKKRTQFKCKVCSGTFFVEKKFRKDLSNSKYYCPHCGFALYRWKQKPKLSIYKCPNRDCSFRSRRLKQLNRSERLMQKLFPTHFSITYNYRDFHLSRQDIQHSAPEKMAKKIFNIHNPDNVLGLVLSLYISYAISARKTAHMLNDIFKIKISHQTVLNYAKAASYYCHKFNLKNKSAIDNTIAGDETYIKIKGINHYVWFVISTENKAILSYHLADNRGTIPAIATLHEATRSKSPDQEIILVTDGNPSYTSAIMYLNKVLHQKKLKHVKVIGLQNLDEESEEYRVFKQIIERLNRTFKFHVRPAEGFNSFNGAMAHTTLFVTHYNFLRRHSSLKYKTPVHIKELDNIETIQERWIKLIDMAAS